MLPLPFILLAGWSRNWRFGRDFWGLGCLWFDFWFAFRLWRASVLHLGLNR